MIWLILEALVALALLVGIVLWVALPAKKKRGVNNTAPEKPPPKERE
ncbi:MAG: hypothetical protein K0U15_04650 [Proteobacteria bacterium]|nr:hypothetical protein [Pseudomonadota bacterium]MCH9757492.1 hypothetical protein [Pseudomonadota bacterium]